MDTDTVVIDAIPRRDTRRSWRALRTVTVWLSSVVAAFFGFWVTYTSLGPGNSTDQITKFESRLAVYISAANAAAQWKLEYPSNKSEFDPILYGYPVDDGHGHPATPELTAASGQLVTAFNNLADVNRNCAEQLMDQASAIYDQRHAAASDNPSPWTHDPIVLWDYVSRPHWVVKGQVILKSLGVAAASAIVAWIAAWFFVVCAAFAWWFCIDRLRDIATAVRGK